MNDRPFDFSLDYKVALKSFISSGRDGYECFKDPAVTYIRDAQNAPIMQDIMYGVFDLLSPDAKTTPLNEKRKKLLLEVSNTT